MQSIKNLSSRNFVFAFDLHEVILFRSWKLIFKYILKFPNKLTALYFLFNLRFLFNVGKVLSKSAVGDEIYDKLVFIHPKFSVFKKNFIDIENIQLIDLESERILKELKRNDFKIYLLSNIGPRALFELEKKFPDLFKLFDGKFIPQKEKNYLQKPDPKFYEDFSKYLVDQGDHDKKVLFVDDKIKNIKAAEKMGFECIHFTSIKNFEEILKNFKLMSFDN